MNSALKLTVIAGISVLSFSARSVAAESAGSIAPDLALARLKEGNARFAASQVSTGKPTASRRAETAQAQHPFAIIVGCADARTAPEIVFDQNIGDLFVIRTAGNVVDDHALGSIEHAVEHLGVRLVVVLGHERCEVVKAALASATAPGHMQSVVRDIQAAVHIAKAKKGDVTDAAMIENARMTAARIEAEANLGALANKVRITSAMYDLETGRVTWSKEASTVH